MPDDYDEHCHGECVATYDEDSGEFIDDGIDCAHCECCCGCLSCEYGPHDGVALTEQQRAHVAAFDASSHDGGGLVEVDRPDGRR